MLGIRDLLLGKTLQPLVLDAGAMTRGRFVKLVARARDVRRVAARNLVLSLGTIDTSHIWEHRGVTPERCARILADVLAVPPLDPAFASRAGTTCLRLDLAITAMRAGKAWLPRFVAGLLDPPGRRDRETSREDNENAWLQVEGIVTELGKSRPALSFAHRRDREAALGFSRSGHVLNGAHAIAEASIARIAGDIAYDVLREIGAAFTK